MHAQTSATNAISYRPLRRKARVHEPYTSPARALATVRTGPGTAPSPMLSADMQNEASDDDRFRLAMASSGIGMAIVDLQGHWVEVNPAFERMFGYGAGELVGRPTVEFTHPDDIADSRRYLRGLIDGSIPVLDAQKRYLHRNGEVVWAHLNVAVMRDDDGAPLLPASCSCATSARSAPPSWRCRLNARSTREHAARDCASQPQLQLFADAASRTTCARRCVRSTASPALLADQRRRPARRDRPRLPGAHPRRRGAHERPARLRCSSCRAPPAPSSRPTTVDLSLLAEWVGAELQDAEPQRARRDPGAAGPVRRAATSACSSCCWSQLMDNAWKFSREREPIRIDGRGDRAWRPPAAVGSATRASASTCAMLTSCSNPSSACTDRTRGAATVWAWRSPSASPSAMVVACGPNRSPKSAAIFHVELPAAVATDGTH